MDGGSTDQQNKIWLVVQSDELGVILKLIASLCQNPNCIFHTNADGVFIIVCWDFSDEFFRHLSGDVLWLEAEKLLHPFQQVLIGC